MVYEQKGTYDQMDFAVTYEYREKVKRSKKIDKYINLTRELNNLRIIKILPIQIVVLALGTVCKDQAKKLVELWRPSNLKHC